jgi:glycosyltransferase involved in cell wall biosynthesis
MARILLAGTYDPDFSRNRRQRELLTRGGHEIVECRVDLWGGDRYKIVNEGKLRMLSRAVLAYPRLIVRFLRAPRCDAVMVLHPGWFDVVVLAPLARLRGMPLVFDAFISLYDTVVSDRALVSPRSLVGRFCRIVDRLSLRFASRVIADTPAHADSFAELARIPRDRIGVVWVGADDTVFRAHPVDEAEPRRVLFYGSFIALHGLETIVRAAKLLEADGVSFRIIGAGQEQQVLEALLAELKPSNVELRGVVPLAALADEIARASVCLGIFGTSAKAARVIPHKVFECAAEARAVVTADTEAIRGAFEKGEISAVPPGDASALADAIRALLADDDARAAMGAAARARYEAEFSTDVLVRLLDAELAQVIVQFRPL